MDILKHISVVLILIAFSMTAKNAVAEQVSQPTGIPIAFTLDEPGFVTLVVENMKGKRVRNLVSETKFPAGKNVVYWDGLDDVGRKKLKSHVYEIDGKLISPGKYQIRGLVRPQLKLKYQFTVNDAGSPPWYTNSRSSAWLGDHSPPEAVLWVDEDQSPERGKPRTQGGQILVGSRVVEGGSGLAWLNLSGRKIYGQKWVGGVWTGAARLARDTGKNSVKGVIAYAAADWKGGGYDGEKPELRISEILTPESKASAPRDKRFGAGMTRPLLKPNKPYNGMLSKGKDRTPEGAAYRFTFPSNDKIGISGLAVHNALLVAALPKMDMLLFVDANKRQIIAQVKVPTPVGIAFDKEGRLLVIEASRRRVVRYNVDGLRNWTSNEAQVTLPKPDVVIEEQLEEPRQVAIDTSGKMFVSDWGKSHQVKVFGHKGELIRCIGNPGLPKVGTYDPEHMNFPEGVTIDSRGRLWVAEANDRPKRLSVWTQFGKCVDAFYGPGRYSGGGTLDTNGQYLYYDGLRFKLDWDRHRGELDAVTFRDATDPLKLPLGSHQRPATPERPIHLNGQTYLTNAWSTNPTSGAEIAVIWRLDDDKKAIPVAYVGSLFPWRNGGGKGTKQVWELFNNDYKSLLPEGTKFRDRNLTAYWFDANGDGLPQPRETVLQRVDEGSITVGPDLSFTTGLSHHFAPQRFTKSGVPIYNFNTPRILIKGARKPVTSGGGQVFPTEDNWLILTVPPEPYPVQASLAGAKSGKPLWTYPSLWPGLHPSHRAPLPQHPGQVIGTTRMLGPSFTLMDTDIEIWAQNSDKSNIYLMTTDGLFIATLFTDSRKGDWNYTNDHPGLDVTDASTGQESFYPTITQTDKGEVYLVVGARTSSSIVRVDGLQRIRRLPDQVITVTADQIDQVTYDKDNNFSSPDDVDKQLHIAKLGSIRIDGKLNEWEHAQWVRLDDKTEASIAVTQGKLLAAYRTSEPDLINNQAERSALLFTGGGGLDLMLGLNTRAASTRRVPVAGDIRIVVAKSQGQITAMLYRPVGRDSNQSSQSFVFRSPVKSLKFDSVTDISKSIELGNDGRGNFELSISLAALGIKYLPTNEFRGDVGVLRGNGFQTKQRLYWSNQLSALTSDVPSEAELRPDQWGRFQLSR